MTRRRLLTLGAAVLLTLFGTFILVAYVNSAESRALEGQDLVDTVVVTDPIPQGTPTTEMADSVEIRGLPVESRAQDAMGDLTSLRGDRVAAVELKPGEQVLASRLVEPDDATAPGGEAETDKQVVTISIDRQRAVGGDLRAGQLVGVIASFDQAEVPDEANPGETKLEDASTGMVLQQVPVTAVAGGVSQNGQDAAGAVMVSLAVDQPDAELVVFAAEHGRIWLTRQTAETSSGGGRVRTLENVFDRIEDSS